MEKVCAVLDIEAFQHKKLLFYRELAFAPIEERSFTSVNFLDHPVFHYSVNPKFIPPAQDRELWRTFSFIKYKTSGLDLFPDSEAESIPQDSVQWITYALYHYAITKSLSSERCVVAYKGGHLERDLLNWLNIPSLNLEDYNIPTFHSICEEEKLQFSDCGEHRYSKNGPNHCAMKEAAYYRLWLQRQVENNPKRYHRPTMGEDTIDYGCDTDRQLIRDHDNISDNYTSEYPEENPGDHDGDEKEFELFEKLYDTPTFIEGNNDDFEMK